MLERIAVLGRILSSNVTVAAATRGAISVLVLLFMNGCPLVDEIDEQFGDKVPDHCEAGRATDPYLADAIMFESASERWVFHSWKGSGGGCVIPINVKDAQGTFSPNVQAADVRQAVTSGIEKWRNVIDEAAVQCDVAPRFQSLGDPEITQSPRIDIEFVPMVRNGTYTGVTEVTVGGPGTSFTHVLIQVAATLVADTNTIPLSKSDYQRVIVHELGHAFGIFGYGQATGHSTNPEDVMYHGGDCTSLSEGDAATMRELYSRPAYYLPAASTGTLALPARVFQVACPATIIQ